MIVCVGFAACWTMVSVRLAGLAAVVAVNVALGHETMTGIVTVRNAQGTGHAAAIVSTVIAVVNVTDTTTRIVIVTEIGNVTAIESIVVVIRKTCHYHAGKVVRSGNLAVCLHKLQWPGMCVHDSGQVCACMCVCKLL